MSQTPCDIQAHFEDFIKLEKISHNGQDYVVKRIVQSENPSCVQSLVNSNSMFFNYLLTNFTSPDLDKQLLEDNNTTDSNTLDLTIFKQDTLFNALLADLADKTIHKEEAKDTLTLNQLLNVAVKYFSITKITEEGYYSGKVCAGLNDIKATEKNRKPFVEAFCFSSILNNYRTDEFSLYGEFVTALRELYSINLGIDEEDSLLRAQGAMYVLMKNNEQLSKMLKAEYIK